MTHALHTVVISYERPELLRRTLESYLDTVTLPYTLIVVDNGSGPEVVDVLESMQVPALMLGANHYPGYAANRGFEMAPPEATLLHRSDNDMEYLPGWCDEVVERFKDPNVGQVGLRTVEEEGNPPAVGGNCVLRREAFEAGARYGERPWTQIAFEDGALSWRIRKMGLEWVRVTRPCAEHIGIATSDDPYYIQTFGERGITFAQYGIS